MEVILGVALYFTGGLATMCAYGYNAPSYTRSPWQAFGSWLFWPFAAPVVFINLGRIIRHQRRSNPS